MHDYPKEFAARVQYELTAHDRWYRSKASRMARPESRFGINNYTVDQIEAMFAGFRTTSYAVDGMTRLPRFLGRFAYQKYVIRLCCAAVYLAASRWHRVRIIVAVHK